jgi:endonuclease-3 related protein
MNEEIYLLFQKLYQRYGEPVKYWPNWCAKKKILKQRETILIGAILTQRTSWHNAEIALNSLKQAELLSVSKIPELKLEELGKLIKPAGFWTTKPRRLIELCSFLIKNYSGLKDFLKEDLSVAREKLLSLYGIGPETADTILLYACDQPTFVIDEYTRRFARKHKLAKNLSYDYLKKLFEKNLPKDYKVFQNFHALIIVDQVSIEKAKMNRF